MNKIKIKTNMISKYEIEEDKFFAMYWMDYEDWLESRLDKTDTTENRKKYIVDWAWETVPYFGDSMVEIFDDCDIEVAIEG